MVFKRVKRYMFGHVFIDYDTSPTVPNNCEYVDRPGTYLPFTDTYISFVTDIEECRAQCSSQGQYNCRSFNYNAFRKVRTAPKYSVPLPG